MNTSLSQNYKPLMARKYTWLFLGRVMPLVSLFLITLIYARKLTYNEYGTYQSVWMYANIINVIISFGFSSIILSTNLSFLLSFFTANKKSIAVFYSLLWLAGFTIFFFTAKNFTPAEKFWLIVFMVIQNIITVAETLLIKREQEKLSFAINFFYSLFFFGWHIYILASGYSLVYLIAGITIISLVKLAAILLVPLKKENEKKNTEEKHFIQHWAYLGINEVLGVISRWIDKVFLLYLLTATDFAVFFNGSFEIPLFSLLISVAGSLLMIEFSANMADKNKIQSLFTETFNTLSSIVFPLFFFLFFFRAPIFSLLFENKYTASVPIFAISVLILPLRINNYSSVLQSFSQGKKILAGSVIDICLALFLMITLYPFMGSRGIALSVVISTYCQTAYYLYHSAAVLKTPLHTLFPYKILAIKFGSLLVLYLVLFLLIKNLPGNRQLIIAAACTTIIAVAAMWSYFKALRKKNYG